VDYAYEPERWHDLFLLLGGAAGSLTGLVFVAVAIHLKTVLGDPILRNRARVAFLALIALLAWCVLALFPGQNSAALGWEVIVVVALFLAFFVYSMSITLGPRYRVASRGVWARTVLTMLTGLLLLFSGLSLVVGWGGGMILLAAGDLIGLAIAVQSTWSLLAGVAVEE